MTMQDRYDWSDKLIIENVNGDLTELALGVGARLASLICWYPPEDETRPGLFMTKAVASAILNLPIGELTEGIHELQAKGFLQAQVTNDDFTFLMPVLPKL